MKSIFDSEKCERSAGLFPVGDIIFDTLRYEI